MAKLKILLCGYCGHMGREVIKLAEKGVRNAEVTCGIDVLSSGTYPVPVADTFDDSLFPEGFDKAAGEADCVIDFSHHSCTAELLDFASSRHLPVVLCTTGQTAEENAEIERASRKIPIFRSANMSLGVALLIEMAKKTAAAMPEAEIEIIEKHHNRKIDAPSGTALMIANAIKEIRPRSFAYSGRSGQGKRTPDEIGIHSIRMGNIVGEHEVMIGTENQTITLKHEAHSRALFAEGALAAAGFLKGKGPGIYDMKDMIAEDGTK